jgi:hypothetical protein
MAKNESVPTVSRIRVKLTDEATTGGAIGKFRWVIGTLLFLGISKNYMDQQVFLTDPVWWFYLFWLPGFLQKEHGLNLVQLGLPLVAIYVISDAGSTAGGWFSSRLIRGGFSVNAGRKIAMLVCAVCVMPIVSVYSSAGLWQSVLLIGLAAAAHPRGSPPICLPPLLTCFRERPSLLWLGSAGWPEEELGNADCQGRRICPAVNWQLSDSVPHFRLRLCCRRAGHTVAGSAAGQD